MDYKGIMFTFKGDKWIVKEIKRNNRCIAININNGDMQRFNIDFIKYKLILQDL
ncbi:MAG: hypothetical protein J6D47_20640 [Peptostreptococcaceae bacterium]|nr:hypothetical protein [Peptostreptococcaceae bacterium]